MRKLDFEKDKYFECGRRHFEVSESLSFARYRESQKIMLEFGFSASFQDVYNNLNAGVDYFNKMKYYEMSIVLYKTLEGIKNIMEKDDPALRLCALFINEKDEDVTKFSEAMMKSKIDCWAEELEVSPFFYLAASLVLGWAPAYELHIQNSSNQETESPEE